MSLGMCILVCLSTYISFSVPVTSFDWNFVKIEEKKTKKQKKCEQEKQTRIVPFCFGCCPLYFLLLRSFQFFFAMFCSSPFSRLSSLIKFCAKQNKNKRQEKEKTENGKKNGGRKWKKQKQSGKKTYGKCQTKGSGAVCGLSALSVKCVFLFRCCSQSISLR